MLGATVRIVGSFRESSPLLACGAAARWRTVTSGGEEVRSAPSQLYEMGDQGRRAFYGVCCRLPRRSGPARRGEKKQSLDHICSADNTFFLMNLSLAMMG
jgi:hypothetical protein